MGSNSKKAYGAARRDDVLWFHPEDLVVVTDKSHPLYDSRAELPLDEAMVKSIMADGVLEPVLVRKNGQRKNGTPLVEVLAGRQRVKNACEANRRLRAKGKEPVLVPAITRRGEDGDLFGVMITENEVRKDNGPMERARLCARYMRFGKSEEQAAVRFGVTETTIRSWLALLELSKDAQEAVERGELTASVAVKLAKLPREEQPAVLEKLKADGEPLRGERGATNMNGATGHTPRLRMRGRKHLQRMLTVFEKSKDPVPKATAILKYLLGDDDAISKKWHGAFSEKERELGG
jgi:ParB family chromosome partitioning protein